MFVAPVRIPVAGPSISEREPAYAAEAARTAWYGNAGSFVSRFENAMAGYVGVPYAIATPHCTAGLHLILAAMGIGPGDEVIVPDVTWIASVAPVTYVGATPVLVDIRPDTWCIDPEMVEAAIGPRTRAIIGVDLYGSMCDWPRLETLAEKHGLMLIEDAAEALGSSLGGRRAGAFGHASAFSFHGSKTLATGEGGMLLTSDPALRERVLVLRDHGRPTGDRLFLNSEFAFKYRMNDVTAAVGLAQAERLEELITAKRQIFAWYEERLRDLQGLALNVEPAGVINSYWMVTVVPDADFGFDKFELMAAFARRNIDTRPFFSRLSRLPALDGRSESTRLVTGATAGDGPATRGVNLPSGYHMDQDRVDIVCRALRDIFKDGSAF
mgnify:CR=1 FL=1